MAKVHPITAVCVLPDNVIQIGENNVRAIRVEPATLAGFYLLTVDSWKDPVGDEETKMTQDRYLVSPATVVFVLGDEEERPEITVARSGPRSIQFQK